MKNKKELWKYICILLLPLGFIMTLIAPHVPDWVERIYANGIYRILVQPLSKLTGLLPISLGELLVTLLVLWICWQALQTALKIIKSSDGRISLVKRVFINALTLSSIIYFSFLILWGFNYYRLPFGEIAHLDTRPASIEELENLCSKMIEQANQLREKVNEDSNGVITLSSSKMEVLEEASKGYAQAAQSFPELGGDFGSPKTVILSRLMSMAGIDGIYSPFTGEANVNAQLPSSVFPATACHEMAHQRGFAREDEANFIAYLVCRKHPDVQFQYSGTLLALTYSMNALSSHDHGKYSALVTRYSPGIRRDLSHLYEFYQRYETPLRDVSSAVNDAYLKANRQEEGVQSYGRMVDLLIAFERGSALSAIGLYP